MGTTKVHQPPLFLLLLFQQLLNLHYGSHSNTVKPIIKRAPNIKLIQKIYITKIPEIMRKASNLCQTQVLCFSHNLSYFSIISSINLIVWSVFHGQHQSNQQAIFNVSMFLTPGIIYPSEIIQTYSLRTC